MYNVFCKCRHVRVCSMNFYLQEKKRIFLSIRCALVANTQPWLYVFARPNQLYVGRHLSKDLLSIFFVCTYATHSEGELCSSL